MSGSGVYRTVELAAGPEEALAAIRDAVPGVRVVRADDRVELYDGTGVRLATLVGRAGGAASTLTYRTSLVTPALAPARAKARRIRGAVEPLRRDAPGS